MIKKNNDDVYQNINLAKKISKYTFYTNIISAVVLIIFPKLLYPWLMTVQSLVAIVNLLSNFVTDYHLFPLAEKINLERNMGNAFGVAFHDTKIEDYYDNNTANSIKKFVNNSLENIFYTRYILRAMLEKQLIKLVACVSVFVIGMFFTIGDSSHLKLFLFTSQTLLSGQFILSFVRFWVYKKSLETLYEKLYSEYHREPHNEFILLGYVIEYESLKSANKMMLDSKVYSKKKSDIEELWKAEKEKLKIR